MFDKELPDAAIIGENQDLTQLLKIGGAMVCCFIAGAMCGLAYMNMMVVPYICH